MATRKTATEVIQDFIKYYKDLGLDGEDLWESIKSRFEKRVKDNTIALDDDDIKDDLFKLRTLLRRHGVNIRRRSGLKVSTAFQDWLMTPIGKWADEDLISIMKDHEKELPDSVKRQYREQVLTPKNATKNVTDTPDIQELPAAEQIAQELPAIQDLTVAITTDDDVKMTLVNIPQCLNGISKMITEDTKYNGLNGALDHKIRVFKRHCKAQRLPVSEYLEAMGLTLKGPALDYYHEHEEITTVDGMVTALRQRFEGANFLDAQITRWDNVLLQKVRQEHPDKTASACIDLLVFQLNDIRRNLGDEYKSDRAMHTRILRACRGSKECELATATPPGDLSALINSLKSCASNYIALHGDPLSMALVHVTDTAGDTANTFLTDRRYNRNYLDNKFGRFNRRDNRYNSRFTKPDNRLIKHTPRNDRNKRPCYVCQKPDCWSTNHTQDERNAARKRYYERTQQYLTDIFDEDDKSDSSVDSIEQFMADIDFGNPE